MRHKRHFKHEVMKGKDGKLYKTNYSGEVKSTSIARPKNGKPDMNEISKHSYKRPNY